MQTQFGGYPAFEIMYDKDAKLVDPNAQAEAVAFFRDGAGKTIGDIIVISHGWNNDIADARALYGGFFNAFRATQPKTPVASRAFGVIALFWPSKKFADADLISGGAAGLGTTSADDVRLAAQLDTLEAIYPEHKATIDEMRALAPDLDRDPAKQDAYVQKLGSLLPPPSGESDEGLDDAHAYLMKTSGRQVLQNLSTPFVPVVPPSTGGAAGLGLPSVSGVGDWFHNLFGGVKAAAADLGNVATYYAMKERAGVIGRSTAAATVKALAAARPGVRIHLVGHSFGGRLVTSLANALDAGGAASMTLLEAAYSHNGLAKNWDGAGHDGAFRNVIAQHKVSGPILITHSAHDFPVGSAYPIASRVMNQVAAAVFGGPDDKYGGMGRNGAQHTPEAVFDTLHFVGTPYGNLGPGNQVRNLNGDGSPTSATITAHGDVAKVEITYAMQMHLP